MEIRADLTMSHDRVWASLALPGTWLTSEARIGVVLESRQARDCELCRERKAALSPFAVAGAHTTASDLSPTQVEAVHRLVTDPGRVTRSWVDGLLDEDMTDAEYVEIAGLVSAVTVVDTFHAALGLPLRDLPTAGAGQPTRKRPRTAAMDGGYVPMIAGDALALDTAAAKLLATSSDSGYEFPS